MQSLLVNPRCGARRIALQRVFVVAAMGAIVMSCSGKGSSGRGTGGGGGTPGTGGVAGSDAGAGAGGVGGSAGQDAGVEASAGSAGDAALCPGGFKPCSGSCVPVTDPAHGCAATSCAPCNFAHATASCSGGACTMGQCDPGYDDCDQQPADGCEVDTSQDTQNCGQCGRVCLVINDTMQCNQGSCSIASCDSGWGNCSSDPTQGCNVDLLNNMMDCGQCGHFCNLPHATSSCVSGQCQVTTCDSGWADCDQDGLSCETDTLTDPNNCGGCGTVCPSGQSCVSGSCG